MKTLITCIAAVLLLTIVAPATADITMTFEEFLGSNGAPISTFYSGVSFTALGSGDEWVAGDGTTGSYQVSSWPSGAILGGGGYYWIYGNVFGWTEVSGSGGKISFDNADASYVELGYASGSTFFLEAYDADDNLIDSDNGPANRRYLEGNESGPGTLYVSSASHNIAYVLVHDDGNYWCIDNVTTDATDIVVPVPGAILLGLLGLSAAGIKLRKFA